MKIFRTVSRNRRHAFWLLLPPLALCAGCSGINVSKSVSPLDFILPGLMQVDPPQPLTPGETNALVCRQTVAPSRTR